MRNVLLILAAALMLAGCRGDDSIPPPTQPTAQHLRWDVPITYTDNSPLAPADIDRLEGYLSDNSAFDGDDTPDFAVRGVGDNSFDLRLLYPFYEPPKFIAMRTICRDNSVSTFSAPIWWGK
jgi:hypothetical protein